jgi:nitroreductase family protein
MWETRPDGQPGPRLAACLRSAIAAPSVHNSQPWRFRVRPPAAVDILEDRTRSLEVIDPTGRELMISLGAAVLNLRVAMSALGRLPLLLTFPDRMYPEVVARITAGPYRAPDSTVRALADAIPRRHTNRRPFHDTPLPADVLDELVAAARAEGGRLVVADAAGREGVLGLVRSANEWQRHNQRYVDELARWTAPQPGRRDGIPAGAFGPWDVMETLPVRDFGQAHPNLPRRQGSYESAPTIAILYTQGDGPRAWLTAGQALQRVLLTATVRSVASTPMTAPIELEQMRELLTLRGPMGQPQIILRLGYGEPCAVSPRRPLEEVLELAQRVTPGQ